MSCFVFLSRLCVVCVCGALYCTLRVRDPFSFFFICLSGARLAWCQEAKGGGGSGLCVPGPLLEHSIFLPPFHPKEEEKEYLLTLFSFTCFRPFCAFHPLLLLFQSAFAWQTTFLFMLFFSLNTSHLSPDKSATHKKRFHRFPPGMYIKFW